jgi:hypothetical protein
MILLIVLMLVIALILALVDGWVPTRPSWLLNLAVILAVLAVLLMIFTGESTLTLDT